MIKALILCLQLFVFSSLIYAQSAPEKIYEARELSILSINAAITPATLDYLDHQFKKMPPKSMAVIKLNTPGGLVHTTKDIITLIGKQDFPIVVWITPEGASASSAGAIIAASAHFIFMGPGTNLGAATPVGLGEDLKEGDGRKKAMNDLAAMVRSLCELRGRPADPFEKMITEAKSFTDQEAKDLKIIDGILSFESEIKEILQGRKFSLKGVEYEILFKDLTTKEYDATPGQKILEVFANPSLAYILFLLGIALIYFELQAPGGFIAGSVGFLCLILAAISFQVLPLNWGAFGLIVAGIFLLILEVFVTSYGLLGIFGVVSLVMGSLFLFHTETSFISIQYPVIFSTLAGILLSVGFMAWYLFREQKKQKTHPDFFLPQQEKGVVLNKLNDHYQVKVRGEIWSATSEEILETGDKVEIFQVDSEHLKIKVKKLKE